MPRLSISYLDGSNIYICKYCNTHLTALNELISRVHAANILGVPRANRQSISVQPCVSSVIEIRVNVRAGEQVQKKLLTGVHIVSDIFCVSCETLVGWKYVSSSVSEGARIGGRPEV